MFIHNRSALFKNCWSYFNIHLCNIRLTDQPYVDSSWKVISCRILQLVVKIIQETSSIDGLVALCAASLQQCDMFLCLCALLLAPEINRFAKSHILSYLFTYMIKLFRFLPNVLVECIRNKFKFGVGCLLNDTLYAPCCYQLTLFLLCAFEFPFTIRSTLKNGKISSFTKSRGRHHCCQSLPARSMCYSSSSLISGLIHLLIDICISKRTRRNGLSAVCHLFYFLKWILVGVDFCHLKTRQSFLLLEKVTHGLVTLWAKC